MNIRVPFYKRIQFKFTHIMFLAIILLLFSCGKDDSPDPTKIATPKEEKKLSTEKEITSFIFLLTNNPIEVNVVGIIDEENKTITVVMPPNTDVTGLLPEVKTSNLATVNTTIVQDFTAPVAYIITAEDGSNTEYVVTLTTLLTQRQFLQVILDTNPANTLLWDLETTSDLSELEGVELNTENEIVALEIFNKNLSNLPPEIGQLSALKRLQLISNNISILPNEISKLSNLEILIVNSNNLTFLPPEIGELVNLIELSALNNNFSAITEEIVKLKKILKLGISGGSISSFPPEILQLKSLNSLTFGSNSITSIPEEIQELTELTTLNLSGTLISTIPLEICLLKKLEVLTLTSNPNLDEIPPEIGFLSNLKELSFYEIDRISTLPQAVCNLSTYNGLNIRYSPVPGFDYFQCGTQSQKDALISIYTSNPSNTLEWDVNNFTGVGFHENGNPITITLNNKNLTRIEGNIGELTSLETLNVNHNNLDNLPSSLGNIPSLGVITAANNHLTTVPAELGQLSNLALLSITNNPISSIPNEVCNLQIANGGILTLLTDAGEGCN